MGSRSRRNRSSHERRRLRLHLFFGRPCVPCCFCGVVLTPETATLEHVVPLGKGGGWRVRNLVLACGGCNHERGCKGFEWFRGWKRKERGAA